MTGLGLQGDYASGADKQGKRHGGGANDAGNALASACASLNIAAEEEHQPRADKRQRWNQPEPGEKVHAMAGLPVARPLVAAASGLIPAPGRESVAFHVIAE